MKKRMYVFVMAIAMMMMFCGCGTETYTCGYCMRGVKQKPHYGKVLGQEIKLCDDCYDMLKDYQLELK